MTRRSCLLGACLGLAAQAAGAATREDESIWVNLTAMGSVKGDLIYFAEVQPRFGDGASRLEQLLLRPAIGWRLSPAVSVYQGYAHVVTTVPGGRDRNEERFFQQVTWTIGAVGGGTLSSRSRLEERTVSGGDDLGWRLRQMIRYVHPIGDPRHVRALGWAEGFAHLNDTDWGARRGFDQLRSFVGVELPIGGRSTLELGYMNQLTDQNGGNTRVNHIASITLFARH